MRSRRVIKCTPDTSEDSFWKPSFTQFRSASHGMADATLAETSGAHPVTGYAHTSYADALGEFGTPVILPASGGSLLKRPIGNTGSHDAMGCYPLFSCNDWNGLVRDLDDLRGNVISVAVAPDPFGQYSVDVLRSCFDRVVEFKSHFVVDLTR